MYTVYQQFESLGDPCIRTFSDREDAEAYAEGLKLDIVNLIVHTQICVPLCTDSEKAVWDKAVAMSMGVLARGKQSFTTDAARHIADEAVTIDGK